MKGDHEPGVYNKVTDSVAAYPLSLVLPLKFKVLQYHTVYIYNILYIIILVWSWSSTLT